ncbi:MAG: LPS-assembly protein LptD [Gammaproteobacteria bacterium]|nr:LPS-assembly protein LptD [Gammaproteobacteria bacterium]
MVSKKIVLMYTLILYSGATAIGAEQTSVTDQVPDLNPAFIDTDWLNIQQPFSPCTGYYKTPNIPTVSVPEISADSSELAKQGMSNLTGNVIFLDKDRKVSAQKASAYRDPKLNKVTEVSVKNNVEYLTPDFRAVTSQAKANLLDNTAILDSHIFYRYYPNNARGQASRAVIIKDQKYNIYDAIYTTCPPNNSDWKINAKEIIIDPNKQVGTAKHTVLYFYDIPIFYSPYLSFPTSKDRKSGFLMPVYNTSDRYGYSIAEPYYLNLAPNYDATITSRYMTKRDSQFNIETRYLNPYGINFINGEFLPYDPSFSIFRRERLLNPPAGIAYDDPRLSNLRQATPFRYAVKIKDNEQWTPNLSSYLDYNFFSDNQYIIDLPPSELLRNQAENHVLQQANINYNYNNWSASALIKAYQTLHTIEGPSLTEPYRIMPGLSLSNPNITNLNLENLTMLPMSLHTAVDAHIMRFATPLHPEPFKTAEGQRYYIKPSISLPVKKPYGYLTPKVALSTRYYDLNRLNEISRSLNYDYNQSYLIPIYSLDSGLFFDRRFNFQAHEYNQTIEPRLFYLYIPYKKQYRAPDFDIKESTLTYDQLFRDNRFYGFDRQSDANQLTAGLISRIQNFSNGVQYVKLQVGQSFYFDNKKVTICNQTISPSCIKTEIPDYKTRLSPLVTEVNINFEPEIYGRAEWQWDYLLNKTRKINAGLHYAKQKSPQTLLNIEYNFLKEGNIQSNVNGYRIFKVNNENNDLSEIEGSLKLPVHNNLNLLGFSSFDLTHYATLDSYIGAELQKCCWALRFGYRNQLRLRTNSLAKKKYDNMYMLQFSLKGLGELNEHHETRLRNNIPGYYNYLNTIY